MVQPRRKSADQCRDRQHLQAKVVQAKSGVESLEPRMQRSAAARKAGSPRREADIGARAWIVHGMRATSCRAVGYGGQGGGGRHGGNIRTKISRLVCDIS